MFILSPQAVLDERNSITLRSEEQSDHTVLQYQRINDTLRNIPYINSLSILK